jgi:uncharacterized membrane protein
VQRKVSVVVAAATVAVVTGVVLRFVTWSAMWLDEAQSVAISSLPISQIPDALRQDGAPPLYYVLLHVWMAVFGDSDFATRAMSGVFSVAAIAVAVIAMRQLAGRRAAAICCVVLATNPLAIRYATEARMYSLLTLEVALALVAFIAAFRPDRQRQGLVGLALATGALLYTHYWGLYLAAAAVAVCAGWMAWRPTPRRRAVLKRTLIAIGVGFALWLPWLPAFLYQSRHTGTPWARPAPPATIVVALFDLNGGLTGAGLTLTLVVLAAVAIAVFIRRNVHGRLELLGPRPSVSLGLMALVLLTLIVALSLGLVSTVAYAARYVSVVLIPFVVVAALGFARLNRRAGRIMLTFATVIALVATFSVIAARRSQAPRFASALKSASAGDVIVYCPDQLGPATVRLLDDRFIQLGYPRGEPPTMVNWVDYADAWVSASPRRFAMLADYLAASHEVWVVINTNYYGTESSCRALLDNLLRQRPGGHVVVGANGHYFENASLWELPPG